MWATVTVPVSRLARKYAKTASCCALHGGSAAATSVSSAILSTPSTYTTTTTTTTTTTSSNMNAWLSSKLPPRPALSRTCAASITSLSTAKSDPAPAPTPTPTPTPTLALQHSVDTDLSVHMRINKIRHLSSEARSEKLTEPDDTARRLEHLRELFTTAAHTGDSEAQFIYAMELLKYDEEAQVREQARVRELYFAPNHIIDEKEREAVLKEIRKLQRANARKKFDSSSGMTEAELKQRQERRAKRRIERQKARRSEAADAKSELDPLVLGRQEAFLWLCRAAAQHHMGALAAIGSWAFDELSSMNHTSAVHNSSSSLEEKDPADAAAAATEHLDQLLAQWSNRDQIDPDESQWLTLALGALQIAAECGMIHCTYQLGVLRYNSGDEALGIDLLEYAASQGERNAQFWCGHAFRVGDAGLPHDMAKSMKYLVDAVDNGHGGAATYLAQLYLNGDGDVSQSTSTALQLLDKAVSLGDMQGMALLADIRYHGAQGADINYRQALQLYMRAGRLGDTDALCCAAAMYYHGDGVPRNAKKAFNLYQQAAEHQHAAAWRNLAAMYHHGDGVVTNPKAAEYCLELANRIEADQSNNNAHSQSIKLD
jgi:Sel1 repeat